MNKKALESGINYFANLIGHPTINSSDMVNCFQDMLDALSDLEPAPTVDAVVDWEDKYSEEFKKRYVEGKIGDVEVKRRLAEVINELLEPMREKRRDYASRPKTLDEILSEGTKRTKEVAEETMRKVRKAMKIDYIF